MAQPNSVPAPTAGSQLGDQLWNQHITPTSYSDAKQYNDHILELYKIYVGSSQQISDRRGQANTFFLSVNTFLLTALSFIYAQGARLEPRWLIIVPLGAVLVLCYYWFHLIRSYRQLNTAKFLVIDALESRLPARPFVAAEWNALGQGKNPRIFTPLTSTERMIPILFAVLYLAGGLAITFF